MADLSPFDLRVLRALAEYTGGAAPNEIGCLLWPKSNGRSSQGGARMAVRFLVRLRRAGFADDRYLSGLQCYRWYITAAGRDALRGAAPSEVLADLERRAEDE